MTPVSAADAPRRLHGSSQLRAQAQDPQRAYTLRIHLQYLDFRTRQFHLEPDPLNAGTEHRECSSRAFCSVDHQSHGKGLRARIYRIEIPWRTVIPLHRRVPSARPRSAATLRLDDCNIWLAHFSEVDRMIGAKLDEILYHINCLCQSGLVETALPDHEDAPPLLQEPLDRSSVSFNIGPKLLRPKGGISGRIGGLGTTGVTMPETAMNLYRNLPFRQHDIWSPRKSFVMNAKSEASRMQCPADKHLRLRVRCPDPRHHS